MTEETGNEPESEAAEPALELSDPKYWERALAAAGAGGATASYVLQDPDVSAAIKSGKAAHVHAVFTRKHAAAKSEADRGALAAVLANRRLFVDPVASGPTMWTFNGCGTRCYGSQERSADDGTYITTLFVTAVFLPVWPLRQYLVAKAEKGGWFFLGKVPTSSFHRWWKRLVMLGAAAAAIVVGLLLWDRTTHDDVHFVSGLPFPVTVTMGGHEFGVEPGVRATHEYEAGEYHVVAQRTEGGAVLVETDVVVPGDMDLVAYNVLGSAPLYREVVTYASAEVPNDERAAKEVFESLAGSSWVTADDIDHVFEETPGQIDMRRSQRIATRSRAAVWGSGTWLEAAEHLARDDRAADAAALARRVALADPSDDLALDMAYRATQELGEEAVTRAFVAAIVEAAPDEIQAHRMYQTHMEQQGSTTALRERYRAAYEADPTSAKAGYLYARIAPIDDAIRIYEALLPANPEDAWLLRGAGWCYFQRGRFDEAAPMLERYLAIRTSDLGFMVPLLARALVGAGRPKDALETVDALLSVEGFGGSDSWTLMSFYASLRRMVPDAAFPTVAERWKTLRAGEAPEAETLAETAALARDAETVAKLRESVDDPESLRYCDMIVLSRDDVAAAADLALTATPELLRSMDDAAKVAIACELARAGDHDRAEMLIGLLFPQSAEHVDMKTVDGLPDVSGLAEDLDIGLRAALLVAASRRTDDAAKKTALLAEARKFDVLRQVVPD